VTVLVILSFSEVLQNLLIDLPFYCKVLSLVLF
jgi:hypothetical protein